MSKSLEERIAKSIAVLKEDLNTVRAGRANPALLDKVSVDYYGSPTPLKNLSNISVPDPRTLMITPFDPKSIGDIEKAINLAGIGITPSNYDSLKKQEKDGELTEDDLKKELDAVQKTIEKAVKDIDDVVAAKDKEILEI